MIDATTLAEATFKGCAANVGPLIGLDLEVGAPELKTTAEVPEGELAVLPIAVEIDDEQLGLLTLSIQISEIAALARRMLGDDEPDKEREVNEDEIDAIGEVLNLMSGAIDQAFRDHVNDKIRSRPMQWWRTSEPGENAFEEGEFLIATADIAIPDGGTVGLSMRIAQALLDQSSTAESQKTAGTVLCVGLEEETQAAIQPMLESARITVEAMQRGDGDIAEAYARADAIITSGDQENSLELCTELRTDNVTWQLPIILCYREATRDKVVAGIQAGASHVLTVPTEEMIFLKVLSLARD